MSQVVRGEIKFTWAARCRVPIFMQVLDLAERNFAGREQRQKLFTAKEFVFAFTLHCQRIETDQYIIHDARMTHDDAGFAHPLQELPHQGAEFGLFRKIISAGKGGVEGEFGARGARAELRA